MKLPVRPLYPIPMPEWLRWAYWGGEASCRIFAAQSVGVRSRSGRSRLRCRKLGEFGTPDCAAPLTHAIGDDDPRVRPSPPGLGRLQLSHTKPLLWTAAKDPVALVRAGAVEGLLRLGDAEAVLGARELINIPIRPSAAQSLRPSGNRAIREAFRCWICSARICNRNRASPPRARSAKWNGVRRRPC